jgi:hypothetical protein
MRSVLVVSTLTAFALSLSACGTGGSGTTGHARTTNGRVHASRSRPTRIYRVHMSGAAELSPRPPHGTGAAVIAFHGDSTMCWRFAHLHGFTDATIAGIHSGAHGQSGSSVVALSTGPRLHHRGCARVSPALSNKIWTEPGHYNVNIESKQYPQGAVRAQL